VSHDNLLIPDGYGRREITLGQARAKYAHQFIPETWDKHEALIIAHAGMLGVGGAWRHNPSSISAASRAGHSFHQTQRFSDGRTGILAIDYVMRNGSNVHRAPRAGELPLQGSAEAARFGVHINVGTPGHRGFESWHCQDVIADGFASWVRAGRRVPHGHHAPVPVTHHVTASHPDVPKATLRNGSHGHETAKLQTQLRGWHRALPHGVYDPGNPDGKFGARTVRSMKSMQSSLLKVGADGVYGPVSMAAWIRLANYLGG
jgi:hypothetical protein